MNVPKDPDVYIHRIGRSGRYGRKGVAINFVTDRDNNKVRTIESTYKIKMEPLPNDIQNLIKHI